MRIKKYIWPRRYWMEKEGELIKKLKQEVWINREFDEKVILKKICFYKEVEENETIFIKIKKSKLQIGKLLNFYASGKRIPGIIIDFGSLDMENTEEEIYGIEPGFFFKVLDFFPDINWIEEYDSVKRWENELTKNGDRKWFPPISINEYKALVDTKIEHKYF